MGFFGSSDVKFKNQDYKQLKKKALASGTPFVDSEFPPNASSLSRSGKGLGVEWKRPKDLCSNPRLVVDGISCKDLIQGQLGNCWLVAAVNCLSINKELWEKVVVDVEEQDWDLEKSENYAGIFHFRFWRYGNWTDVVIDDHLPCQGGKLIYLHSTERNEFWSALLEKAYAKLFGCYEALDGNELSVALEDFTGGMSEITDLKKEDFNSDVKKKEEFYQSIKRQLRDHALMAASIPATSEGEMEQRTSSGLVVGHAYAVTQIKRIALKGTGLFNLINKEKLSMIRLRNPWGGTEWNGAFSDNSEEWNRIGSGERQKIGLTFDEDGEFWMTFEDFCSHFNDLAVCHILYTGIFSLNRWYTSEFNDEWRNPERAGGCVNNRDSFFQNYQYAFTMYEEDEVIIILTQKNNKEQGKDLTAIGFTMMKVEENRKYRLHKLAAEEAGSSQFINRRSVLLRKLLLPGRYLVIPSTFTPGLTGQFLIRFFIRCRSKAERLTIDKPTEGSCSCLPCFQPPLLLTKVTVFRAVSLKRQDESNSSEIDAYFIIKNEGEKHKSRVINNQTHPEFMSSYIFYRKDPSSEPIKILFYHKQFPFDNFIGSVALEATELVENSIKDYKLKNDKSDQNVGSVIVRFSSSQNLEEF